VDRIDDPSQPAPTGVVRQREGGLTDPALWRQFAEATTREGFGRAWLALQVEMLRGVSTAVLVLGAPDTGPFAPVAFWPDTRRDIKHLAEIAERALAERRALVTRDTTDGVPRFCVASPVQVGGRLHGVIALDLSQRPERDLSLALRQLQWGAGWIETMVLREEHARQGTTAQRLETLLDLAATALGQERFQSAATAFATAVSMRFDCDRVSLGFVRHGRVHVRAVSHTSEIKTQTNIVRAVAAAMEEAYDQRAIVVHPVPPNAATRVTRAHVELAQQQGAGTICSVPLRDAGRVIAVLTLERPAERPFDTTTLELLEALGALVGPILEVQRRDDRWLGAKVLDSTEWLLGRLLGPRHLAWKLGAAAAIAIVAFLSLAQGDYRVTANAVLEPSVRRAAAAPFNGYIGQAHVRPGDVVKAGQVLASLDDRDLRLERAKWVSQQEQLVKQYHQAMAVRNAAHVVILTAQIDQARAELALVDDRLGRTRVTAPFDGVVVAGDLTQMLGAPVEQGHVLFELAPLEHYRLVLQIDERDIADVAVGRRGVLVLSGMPADGIPFVIEKVTPVSTAKDGRNSFRTEARLEGRTQTLRPGMEGIGKVDVEQRLYLRIWTRQVTDWIRLALWRWLP
jgi:multidrug resistance efflux pump